MAPTCISSAVLISMTPSQCIWIHGMAKERERPGAGSSTAVLQSQEPVLPGTAPF